jgi:hypothetical protein
MTAESKAFNMMSSKRNIQNVILQKTHMAPSRRDVHELESEFMDPLNNFCHQCVLPPQRVTGLYLRAL